MKHISAFLFGIAVSGVAFAQGNYWANGQCGETYVETPASDYADLSGALSALRDAMAAAGCSIPDPIPLATDNVRTLGNLGPGGAWQSNSYELDFGTLDYSPLQIFSGVSVSPTTGALSGGTSSGAGSAVVSFPWNLTVEEGAQISAALALVWAVAWGFRAAYRAVTSEVSNEES